MSTYQIGTTFRSTSQWAKNEQNLIENIKAQIEQSFSESNNLLINTTWFGPQFTNSDYFRLNEFVGKIDNLFFLASVDPVMLNSQQLNDISTMLLVKKTYCLGNFDGQYQFNFISTVLPMYFQQYSNDELLLREPTWTFLNYNRKPREHRIKLVEKIIDCNLYTHGKISLGKNNPTYAKNSNPHLVVDQDPDYTQIGNWEMDDSFGIAHDIHTLGNMHIWQNHVVSETEFNSWDNMFITEKTWKPIIGLRPFIINGQTKIYSWLEQQGFKTFTKYFAGIELENSEVHDYIISVLKYLVSLDSKEILEIYNSMLPDLVHNQYRFFEFAQKHRYRIENLFV